MQRYSRVQRKGQVTIPADLRDKMGIKEGDLVTFEETEKGILINLQQALAMRTLDRIGAVLKENGISMEELIEAGREERLTIIREKYGIEAES